MAARQNNPRQQANDPRADAKSRGHTEEQREKILMDAPIAHARLFLQPTCTADQFFEFMFKKMPPHEQHTLKSGQALRKRLTRMSGPRRSMLKTQGVHVLSHPGRKSEDKSVDMWNMLYHARYIIENWHSLKAGMAVVDAHRSGRENALPEVLGISPDALIRLSDIDMNQVVSPQDVTEATASGEDLDEFSSSLGLHLPAATASESVSNTGSSRMQNKGKGKDKIPSMQESRFAAKSQPGRLTCSDSIDWEVPGSDEEATVVPDRETPSGNSSSRRDKRKRDSSATGPRKKKSKPQLPTSNDTVITITSDHEIDLPVTRHQSRGPSRSSPAPQSRSKRGRSVRSPGPSLTQQEMTPPDSTPCHRKPSPPTPTPLRYIRGRTADYQGIPFHKREKAMEMHQREVDHIRKKHQLKQELQKRIKIEGEGEGSGDTSDGDGNTSDESENTSDESTSDESENTSDKEDNRRERDNRKRERKLEQEMKQKEEEEKVAKEREKLKQEKKKKKKKEEKEERLREERGRERRERDKKMRKKEKKCKKKQEQTSESR
uniref:Uncharacterized protein n=1 Tax=Bionectria ochroleuca TaxID=29856 RepID=A0A8H7K8Q8_BIOOC